MTSGRARLVRSRRPGRAPLVLLLPALLAAGVALLPLVYLAVRAFEQGPARVLEILWRDRTLHLLVRSLTLALAVTVACLLVGVSLAWVTSRIRLPGGRAWAVAATVPLAVPSYVAAYAWVAAFPRIAPFWGSLLVLTLCCYPYVFLPVAAALERADPALEEVARSLGRGPVVTVLTVTLRQVWPAATAGALLVALYVLSDFGAVAILRYDAFTRVIYTSYRSSFDPVPAAVLGLLLVAVTIAVVWGESRARGRAEHARLGQGAPRRHVPLALGTPAMMLVVTTMSLVAALAIGFPLGSLGYWLARGSSAGVDASALFSAAGSTLAVSALGAFVTIVLAVPVGVLAARRRTSGVRVIEQATYAAHALPGIVVGLALVFLGVRFAYPLYQRTPMLVLAYAVLFLPAAVGAVRTSVGQSPRILEEVAGSLGHAPLRVLRRVTLPLAGPGIAAGAALVFLTCMKELPATLLLRPTGLDTLATELWSQTEIGRYGGAAPYAALLVLLAALPTFLLTMRRRHEPFAPGTLPVGEGGT